MWWRWPVRRGVDRPGTHVSITSMLEKLTIVNVVVLRDVRRFGFCSFPSAIPYR